MLTLEQIRLGRSYAEHDEHSFEAWLREHAEALLDAAERVARDESRAYEAGLADGRWDATPGPIAIEDDAAFARNEVAAGERLAAARLDDEPTESERDAIIDATLKNNPGR